MNEKQEEPVQARRRSFFILMGDDHFSSMLELILPSTFEATCDFTFARFGSATELWRIARSRKVDLVFCYLGNIRWNGSDWGGILPGLEVLSRLKAEVGVPSLAIQGLLLMKEAERAGVTFLPTPFRLAEFLSVFCRVLKLPPPAPPLRPRE